METCPKCGSKRTAIRNFHENDCLDCDNVFSITRSDNETKPTSKTDALKKESTKLEQKVKSLIEEFIKENGACDIDLNIDTYYETLMDGSKVFIKTDCKARIII